MFPSELILEQKMAKVKKISITTESREVLIFRRENSKKIFREFCENCDGETESLTLDEAVSLSGVAALELVRRAALDEIHFRETADGHLLICAESLLVADKKHSETANESGARWSLTAAAFDKLLSCLDADRERAGEKYLQLRRNLVRFFEGRGFAEAEEAADEVCNRLARKLDAGATIENVNQYAYGVARMLALELRKENARRQKALNEMPPKNEILFDEDGGDDKAHFACLNRCLNELPAENRELILNYYAGDRREKIKNRQALAIKLGIPQNALRNRVVRLRDKLKILFAKNLKKQTI